MSIDDPNPGVLESGPVFLMGAGRGRIEDKLDVMKFGIVKKSVDPAAVVGTPYPMRAAQAVGLRVDPPSRPSTVGV